MMDVLHTDTFGFHLRYRSDLQQDPVFHSHPQHEIYYFHGGRCHYLIGDKIHVLEPGDLILMHGMTLHCANVDSSQAYVRSVIHFNPSYVKEALGFPHALDILKPFRELQNTRMRLTPPQRGEVESLLAKMNALKTRRDAVSYNLYHIAFLELLTFIYGYCEKELKEQESRSTGEKVNNVQRLVTYIEEHYMDDLHLESMEKALHLNKHYMAKMFKQVTGVTIFDYVYQRRINEARIMMYRDKQARITDIGYQVGFKHPAHFSRVFKERTGCAPEEFRRRIQAEIGNHS